MFESAGIAGIVAAIVSNRKTKKDLERIEEYNALNRGISFYQPSQIEAFFDNTEHLNNISLSGGANFIRARAMARIAECAFMQGYAVIAIHCSNRDLESTLAAYFGNTYVIQVNDGNPIYDPFFNRTDIDISSLVLKCSQKGVTLNSPAKYYLDGITTFIRAKGLQPYCRMYINCPHHVLIDQVNDAEAKGIISNQQCRNIISLLMQGEVERGNIEHFFSMLRMESDRLIVTKQLMKYAVNIASVAQQKQIICVDIKSSTNAILLSIITNEIEALVASGRKVMVIADGIQISSCEVFQNFLRKSGNNCCITLSSDDVFSMFGGEENDFFAFGGTCSKIVISKHTSGYSAQKWADIIGSYDKQEISSSVSQNANFVGRWGLGSTRSTSVSTKRENIVKPEEIMRMNQNDALILDRSSGELSFTSVI